jgi:myosin V
MEKQESDAAKRAVTEAHERNKDLLRRNEDLLKRNDDLITKIEESGKIATQLQETIQRYQHPKLVFHYLNYAYQLL